MTPTRLFDLPYYQLANTPQDGMFVTKVTGKWEKISTQEFIARVNACSKGLVGMGVEPGENVGLVSSNRCEWNIMDIAIQQIGAIVVPLYPNISESDYIYIFNDAKFKHCFVSNEELFEKINGIKDKTPDFKNLYTFDKVEGAEHWSSIEKHGTDIDSKVIEDKMAVIKNGDLATIIYTSGTTGNPKGVMLSHNNILSNVLACEEPIPASSSSKVLSFLPVCHIYERMLHYLYIKLGCSIHFAESMETIGDNIREVQPDIFSAVPRLIEKVFDKIMAKGDELTGIKRKLFFWAVELAEEFEIEGKSTSYKIKHAFVNKLIFSKWREALGGNVKAIASGSAALQPRLARIFMAAGIPILEGYGLSETSPVISVNSFQRGIVFGSVGALIDDVEVVIAEDGEILTKGPNLMLGYYNLTDVTAEAIDKDGWFHTGDIGEFIQGKYLKITDRKKEIFKTSGGKYIIPQAMENKFKESRFFEQILVMGESQRFPSALIVPNYAFIREWNNEKQYKLDIDTNEKLIKDEKVIARIQKEVDRYNEGFGQWEKIKDFRLLSTEMSIEGGELTPTLKLKRKKILEKYADLFNSIYEEA